MGLLTGTLIVLGVAAVVGVSGAIWHSCTEDDRAKQRIKELEAENKQLNSAKEYVSSIKTKLTSAKEYLQKGKSDFKNGGHVLDNVPLANPEFESCITKLDGAITNAKNLINDFNATIEQNNRDIGNQQSILQSYANSHGN